MFASGGNAQKLRRRAQLICPTGCRAKNLSSHFFGFSEIFRFARTPNQIYNHHVHPTEGRIAIVTDAGLDAMDAAASGAIKYRADEWRSRVRQRRVVLTPRRWRQAGGIFPAGDGGKKARSPGRARYKP
jgi:hypothetical protein